MKEKEGRKEGIIFREKTAGGTQSMTSLRLSPNNIIINFMVVVIIIRPFLPFARCSQAVPYLSPALALFVYGESGSLWDSLIQDSMYITVRYGTEYNTEHGRGNGEKKKEKKRSSSWQVLIQV